jgi:transcriptional repressor NrdR
MQCPNCGGDTQVSETRQPEGKHLVRRRRVCTQCKHRFTTLEQLAPPPLKVEKRRGGTEPYQRAKLTRCLERVSKHRPVQEQVDDMVEWIESELSRSTARTVKWTRLVNLVLEALASRDEMVRQRMAANYLDVADLLRRDETQRKAMPQLDLFPEGE